MNLNINIPDKLAADHQQNLVSLTQEVQTGIIVWSYLNGHLSLRESAELLNISYREFVDLLWSKGIAIDGMEPEVLAKQVEQLRTLL